MNVRILPSGEAAVLVECDDLVGVLALHDALTAAPIDGLVELVPAARTLLVAVDPGRLPLETAASWVRRAAAHAEARGTDPASAATDAVTVPVVYDGADLASAADALGVLPDELVDRHVAAIWRVAFIGFSPGFAYLVSDDWTFDVPRLASPRTRVPAGAVGLAGTFSGAYPRESPGGWQLIGRTDATLWDPAAVSPALLAPGTTVRFARSPR
ncbi:5-oxoprolinase subunit B family protein [Agromyces aerolatus]|uniref:5-oxoprolinase subunit B family protein n=1 Tax=Agromyces sp. LY-1074 TaxID=3074080 RepID=UPI0028639EE6|nr:MULTISPECIES: allophanate hydrolase subunit 1 [unclassified Agromyces]MDR5698437.1 allophanate hydrolase subunit 1 [Agromyces sp. LY-1074]MDR5704731.1 allophanate hydrolase subunit 1 [Agromyces sp. LY-1358]